MSGKTAIIAAIALAAGLAIGFITASKFDRAELDRLRAENETFKSQANNAASAQTALTDDEIDQRIAEAQTRKDDFLFQKNLGTALYRYAAMKQDADLLVKVKPVVDRAAALGSNDTDVLSTAGNLYFDLAYLKKDDTGYKKAREYYQKVLATRPNDANTLTDLGLAFYLDQSPDYAQAAEKLTKAVELNPQDARALQFAIQAKVKLGKPDDAEKDLAKLKAASSNDPSIAELSSMIEASRSASKQQ